MATTYLSLLVPATVAHTIAARDVAHELTPPKGARRLLLEFQTNAGKYAYTGEDGVDLGDPHHALAADAIREVALAGSGRPVFIQADADATVVTLSWLPE